ncbi:MAG: agmatine deiminase family protein [Phycisphaera sp.]|nr:agmatine deiminase family protein [Phycisphaera sp.]
MPTNSTAQSLGYRMPAEWEPIEAVWVVTPHNAETWPGCMGEARWEHEMFCHAIRPYADVREASHFDIPTNDSWIRDFGPIFVKNTKGELAAHDFVFNGWGGKYETRDLDDAVPQHIAKHFDIPLWNHTLVLEGGSIDVNGEGVVMTTEQCLLNKNRNPHLTREQIVSELHNALGTSHVVWLPGGIIGDDTDGHIDDIARFVAPHRIVAVRPSPGHHDYDLLEKNWQALQQARDVDGKPFDVIALPAPEPIMYNFPPDRFGPGGVNPVPASYANFLIVNEAVIVPTFRQKTDEEALSILERAMPGKKIIGVPAKHLVVGLGSVHCLTMQQPRAGN